MNKALEVSIQSERCGDYAHVLVSTCTSREERGELRPIWPANESLDGLGEQGIVWVCQIDGTNFHYSGDYSYGWTMGPVSASTYHPHNLAQTERMVKAMRRFRKRYDDSVRQFGEPKSFGQFVAWHLAERKARVWWMGRQQNWQAHPAKDLAYLVDRRVREHRDILAAFSRAGARAG